MPKKVEKLERNILANQLIAELEIQCVNRACNWIGKLESIKSHLPDCQYSDDNLPDWFKTYTNTCEAELQKCDEKAALLLEADELDLQQQEKFVPLAMRLFKHDDNAAEFNDQIARMISYPVGVRKSLQVSKKKEDGDEGQDMNKMLR